MSWKTRKNIDYINTHVIYILVGQGQTRSGTKCEAMMWNICNERQRYGTAISDILVIAGGGGGGGRGFKTGVGQSPV